MQTRKHQTVCERLGAEATAPPPGSKLGIALSTLGKQPINGVRHAVTETTNGWYVWCGTELSDAVDFFAPLHVEHLADYLPSVAKFLDLPPGYRFLIDDAGFEDVWFDDLSPSLA